MWLFCQRGVAGIKAFQEEVRRRFLRKPFAGRFDSARLADGCGGRQGEIDLLEREDAKRYIRCFTKREGAPSPPPPL